MRQGQMNKNTVRQYALAIGALLLACGGGLMIIRGDWMGVFMLLGAASLAAIYEMSKDGQEK